MIFSPPYDALHNEIRSVKDGKEPVRYAGQQRTKRSEKEKRPVKTGLLKIAGFPPLLW